MTKVRLLALLAVVALVLLPVLSSITLAQGPGLPCRFHGSVQVDGEDVPDETVITATIEGDDYTTTTPSDYGASTYSLEIAPAEGTTYEDGAEIAFTVDGAAAGTSTWEAGGNVELDLSVGEAPSNGGGDGGGITSVVIETLPAGSDATAELEDGVLTLGIPAGEQGEKGDKGDKGDQGEAGEAGSSNMVIAIIAIVLAAVAILVAFMAMRRKA